MVPSLFCQCWGGTGKFITITMNSGFLGLLEHGDVPRLIHTYNKVQTIKKHLPSMCSEQTQYNSLA